MPTCNKTQFACKKTFPVGLRPFGGDLSLWSLTGPHKNVISKIIAFWWKNNMLKAFGGL